ncbi:MAG: AMP-binding protein, partial [Dehalococcoidia bacterium]
NVENFCLGLVEMGFKAGDTLAIMGDPCPAWVYADIAAECAGGISYGIYPTSAAPEIKYLMENGEAEFFVAEDQEYVDKILPLVGEIPKLKKIIVSDTRALFMYNDPRIMSCQDVKDLGAQRKAREPQLFEEMVSRVKPEDTATLVYTSGTTGVPKGVMISHYNLLWGFLSQIEVYPEVFQNDKSRTVAYLPMAHIMARYQDVYFPMVGGYITHFGESPDTMAETVFEVGPTFLLGPPRIFVKFAAQLVALMENTGYIKKKAYRLAMKVGRRHIAHVWAGRVPWYWKLAYLPAYWLVFRPLLDKVGFKNIKWAMTAAAPVPPQMVALWQTWGMNLVELYGGTEFGAGTAQTTRFARPGNAGKPVPRMEYRVEADGELVVKSPGCFKGYWKNEEATRATKRDDWVYTGDSVEVLPDGNIKILDRIKDLIITAGGKNLTPSEIEKAIRGSPYISEAVVFGHGRKYPTAVIEIDFDTVSEWARAHDVVYTSYTSLTEHPDVIKLVADEVAKGNQVLARVEQVKVFRIIPKELDPEDETDPVTATRKIQRPKLYEKMKDLVESMYAHDEEARIAAEVDGVGASN